MPMPRASAVEDWLIELTAITANAARRELRRPDAGDKVQTGAYGMPTVRADLETEKAMLAEIPNAPIPLNVFSEEIGYVPTPGAKYTVVADPIDGTRNAVRHIPFWCVSLAIGKKSLNDIEIGTIRDGTTGQVYHARKGHGARHDGVRLKVRPYDPKSVIVAAALDYERDVRIQWRPGIHFRDMGSSALEMCMVAKGGIDVFLSTKAYLRVVDIAASTLILREAGGHVLDLQKKPLNAGYDLKERISMIALGDRNAWKVLR